MISIVKGPQAGNGDRLILFSVWYYFSFMLFHWRTFQVPQQRGDCGANSRVRTAQRCQISPCLFPCSCSKGKGTEHLEGTPGLHSLPFPPKATGRGEEQREKAFAVVSENPDSGLHESSGGTGGQNVPMWRCLGRRLDRTPRLFGLPAGI